MKFSLATIAYVFALLAAAMGAFGWAGIVAGGWILFIWALVTRSSTGRERVATVVAGLAFLVLGAWFASALPAARESARTSSCVGQLSQMSLAIRNYEAVNKVLPQAVVSAADGTMMHSWRMLVVPYIESNAWFGRYSMAEPWNSPRNAKLLAQVSIWFYQCPSHADSLGTSTHYFAVVDPRTAWPPNRGLPLREITDGPENTVLLIEAPHKNVPWAKPVDLSFDEAVELLSGDSKQAPHSTAYGLYRQIDRLNLAFADGKVETVTLPLPREMAVAMLTAGGGEEFYRGQHRRRRWPRLDYARCYGLALFVALAAAPGVKLLRRVKSSEGSPAS